MELTETRDPALICRHLDTLLAADPVRNTVLGSVRADLAEPWAVIPADGSCLAARSGLQYPIALSTGWTAAGLAALSPFVRRQKSLAISGPLASVETLVVALDATPAEYRRLRLFRLDELAVPTGVPGAARRADPAHRELLISWVDAFGAELELPESANGGYVDRALDRGGVWLWLDGAAHPVSTAFRRDVDAGSARVGPVYTPPALRGRGYASAVTAAATADVLAAGAIPVLFTEVDNRTSNKIYAALGYTPVEDRLLVRFDG